MKVWKPVHGFAGFYEISDEGDVRALFDSHNGWKSGRILKHNLQKTGYFTVTLCPPGKRPKVMPIHRLLLFAFVGVPKEGDVCRHLDGNPHNNSLQNLCWGTFCENEADKAIHGTKIQGHKQWKSKLTDAAVLAMREMRQCGHSLRQICSQFNISKSAAWAVVSRKTWKHVA